MCDENSYVAPLNSASNDNDVDATIANYYSSSESINVPLSVETDEVSYVFSAETGCNCAGDDVISFECDLAFEEYRFARDAQERSLGVKATRPEDLRKFNEMSLSDAAHAYSAMGLSLIPLEEGTKKAIVKDWSSDSYVSDSSKIWKSKTKLNIGANLGKSNLCTLDIDDLPSFKVVIAGISDELMAKSGVSTSFLSSNAAGIKSGKEGHAKLVFSVPEGVVLKYHSLIWSKDNVNEKDGKCVFELRCGNGHYDVLPPSMHPDTHQPYQWVGTDSGCTLAEMPADLVYLWTHWEELLPTMKKLDPNYIEKPIAKLSANQNRGKYTGQSFIEEWNSYQPIGKMLENYGYVYCGDMMYARPDSRSKNPDTKVNVRGGKVTFYAFATSDFFCDCHQHTPFDLLMHFEFDDDFESTKNFVKEQMTKVWRGA